MKSNTSIRKLEHILVSLSKNVEEGDTLLNEVTLVHQALPELDLEDIDLTTRFLGKSLGAPLMITGMTGGHPLGEEINRGLAIVAEKHKLAIGVGSQRAALENPELKRTFKVVRDEAPSVPVIANIGAPQLRMGDPLETARRVVEMIEADALAVHLNPAQEVFQPGGDTVYRGVTRIIGELAEKLEVPLIVKETGSGLSIECVSSLRGKGVKIFDVAGAGGTSWVKIEAIRAEDFGNKILAEAGWTFRRWGMPTAISIIETRTAAPDAVIIASGGIRTGLDAAKCIALGADMAGIALPALRAVVKGVEALDALIERIKLELKAAMFLTGSRQATDLRRKPIVLGHKIIEWMEQRGINPAIYKTKTRIGEST